MEKTLTMPKLGMTMTEGTVLQWLLHEGERIEKGEPILEVMTDKVNIEVEAPYDGYLARILAQDGETLPVGAPLAMLSDTLVGNDAAQSPSALTVGTALSRPPSYDGPVASTPSAKREATLHGIALYEVVAAGATPPLDKADITTFLQQKQQNGAKPVRATPVAQKMASAHQIDLSMLAERKAGEKVTRADVEAHLASTQQLPQTVDNASPVEPTISSVVAPTAPMTTTAEYELIPLSPIRRLIGQRMQQSITSAPHIYLDTEIDMSEAERCRERIGRALKEQGEPAPSLTAIIIRATAAALMQHPEVNAVLDAGALQGKDAIRRWHAAHIGVAVETGQALLTPVVRNAHQKSIPEIARSLRELVQAARQGTLKPEDMAGATFTISNLGMFGIDTFHAIIAPGQSAILATGKVSKRGVVIEDAQGERLEIRPIMKISLSADHRTLDGAGGSRFLQRLKALLEEPYLLL